ncbi:hypothetical protein AOQ84DRAFT_230630, partial [Glonium stellatum]
MGYNIVKKSSESPSNAARSVSNLLVPGPPEAEPRDAYMETLALCAIESDAVPADQDRCRMQHNTEASTEQQINSSFADSPQPFKAQPHSTSPETWRDCPVDSAQFSSKRRSVDEIDVENSHPEYSPAVSHRQRVFERILKVGCTETPASTRDALKSLRILIPEAARPTGEQSSNPNNAARPSTQRSVSEGVHIRYRSPPSPLSQFIAWDGASLKTDLSDTASGLDDSMESVSGIEQLHPSNSTQIFERENLAIPSACVDKENVEPVQAQSSSILFEVTTKSRSASKVQSSFEEAMPRVPRTPSSELPYMLRRQHTSQCSDKTVGLKSTASIVDSMHPLKLLPLNAASYEDRRPKSRGNESWFLELTRAYDQGPKRSSAPRSNRARASFSPDDDDEANDRNRGSSSNRANSNSSGPTASRQSPTSGGQQSSGPHNSGPQQQQTLHRTSQRFEPAQQQRHRLDPPRVEAHGLGFSNQRPQQQITLHSALERLGLPQPAHYRTAVPHRTLSRSGPPHLRAQREWDQHPLIQRLGLEVAHYNLRSLQLQHHSLDTSTPPPQSFALSHQRLEQPRAQRQEPQPPVVHDMYNADRPHVQYRGLLEGTTSGPANVRKRLREHLERNPISEQTRLDAIADISGTRQGIGTTRPHDFPKPWEPPIDTKSLESQCQNCFEEFCSWIWDFFCLCVETEEDETEQDEPLVQRPVELFEYEPLPVYTNRMPTYASRLQDQVRGQEQRNISVSQHFERTEDGRTVPRYVTPDGLLVARRGRLSQAEVYAQRQALARLQSPADRNSTSRTPSQAHRNSRMFSNASTIYGSNNSRSPFGDDFKNQTLYGDFQTPAMWPSGRQRGESSSSALYPSSQPSSRQTLPSFPSSSSRSATASSNQTRLSRRTPSLGQATSSDRVPPSGQSYPSTPAPSLSHEREEALQDSETKTSRHDLHVRFVFKIPHQGYLPPSPTDPSFLRALWRYLDHPYRAPSPPTTLSPP